MSGHDGRLRRRKINDLSSHTDHRRSSCCQKSHGSFRLSSGEYRGETMTEERAAAGGGAAASAAPANSSGPITPATALQRHVEWLEFALAAARSEEAFRVGRLDKASKKNRQKRSSRLTDVRDEIEELSALVRAIHDLQVPTTSATTPRR